MDAALQERLKAQMAWEFARSGPPAGFPKFPDIPIGRYTSDEFFELEREHLWSKVWVMAGRAEDVAEPGDFMTFDDLGLPILLVRGDDRVLRAFYNTCSTAARRSCATSGARLATFGASTTRGRTTSRTEN